MSAMKVYFQIAECSPLYQKKKDGLILENLLIPLHHDLSLFLPGKLHLSFLAILRKEPQQRPVLFKLIEQFGEITSRLARRRKRNLPTYLVVNDGRHTAGVKAKDR